MESAPGKEHCEEALGEVARGLVLAAALANERQHRRIVGFAQFAQRRFCRRRFPRARNTSVQRVSMNPLDAVSNLLMGARGSRVCRPLLYGLERIVLRPAKPRPAT